MSGANYEYGSPSHTALWWGGGFTLQTLPYCAAYYKHILEGYKLSLAYTYICQGGETNSAAAGGGAGIFAWNFST